MVYSGYLFIPKIVISEGGKETIIIPIKVHIVKEDSGYYTSTRNEENIRSLFEQVNRILSQSDIILEIDEIVVTNLDPNTIPNTINGNYLEISNSIDKDKINVFLTKSLNGINGLALYHINSILISDFTTVNDYRTTAHEIGHLLGLKHVNPSNRLMARGKNGELLTEEEISIIRENALKHSN